MTLAELNQLSIEAAYAFFYHSCGSKRWCSEMVRSRPFNSINQIKRIAQDQWQTLSSSDYIEAFAAHPMIGDITSLKKKYASTRKTAEQEQSGTFGADEEVLEKLKQLNYQYLDKNGFIFIIFATGLSAEQMLSELEIRINNSQEQEITLAAEHQIKITLLRITKKLQPAKNI